MCYLYKPQGGEHLNFKETVWKAVTSLQFSAAKFSPAETPGPRTPT